jgi:hypothetical protein
MNDRTDISCMIAEWWHNQKLKRKTNLTTYEDYVKHNYEFSNEQFELLDSDIVIEKHLKVDSLNPVKISEDYEQLTVRRPDGKKCIVGILHDTEKADIWEREIKTIEKAEDLPKIENSCNTCQFEFYEIDGIDEDFLGKEIKFYRRDCWCLKPGAQDFFRRAVRLKLSKEEIKPAIDCPFWQPRNGKEKI